MQRRRKKKAKIPPPPAPAPHEALSEVATPIAVPPSGELVTRKVAKRKGKSVAPVPVTLEAPAQEVEAPSYQYLRFAAGLAYTTDVNGVSIEDLSKRPPYEGAVPFKTMQRWAVKDQWVARREALALEWRKRVEEKLGERAVQNAAADLTSTDQVLQEALSRLYRGIGQVGSYEGLINAAIRVMEFRGSLRDKMMAAVVPVMGTGNQDRSQMPKPTLSVEDARVAATAIIQRRRAEIREAQEKKEAEAKKEAEESPPLRLLTGDKK